MRLSAPLRSVEKIRSIYATLAQAYGPQHWWPARTRFEVIVGAYLTQNTSWSNVEKALKNLRRAGILNVDGIRQITTHDLEELLRPSGYFRQKALRLKVFIDYLDRNYGGSLRRMFAQPTPQLRAALLDLKGVGPETADAILLYAGRHPLFVVDAYARRILDRHGILSLKAKYDEARSIVEDAFASDAPPERTRNFNELHALMVSVGKIHCNPIAKCNGCPLEKLLPARS